MNRKNSIEFELSPVKLPETNDEQQTSTSSVQTNPNIIENILDRIGIGKFHWITYSIIGICWLCDGAEILALSMLNYVMVHVVWFRDLNDISMMGSCLFGGYFIGSLLSGPIVSLYGRRRPFLIYMILIFIFGVSSALAPNFFILVLTRSCYGVLVGILAPLTSSMITEITPRSKRGINYVLVSIFFTVGEVIAIFIGACLQVEQPGSENWRFLLIWVSLPALISLVIGLKYLEESPRYRLIHNVNEGIRILKVMHKSNHKSDLELTDDENQQIEQYAEAQKLMHTDSPVKEIFSRRNLRTTLFLWISWWVLNFVYYGIVYVLPLVLSKIGKENDSDYTEGINYSDLFVSVLAELPSYALSIFTIEHEKFGRKNSLAISFALTAFCCFGAHFFVDSLFLWFVFFAKFFASSAFNFIYPLTAELYHTSCRTTGLGFATGVSRIGGIMMPWISLWALSISSTATFVTFGGFCLVATVATLLLPYDTAGRELDKH